MDCIVPGIMARALYLSYLYQLFLQYYLILDAFPTKQDLLKKKKKKGKCALLKSWDFALICIHNLS